MCVPMKRKKIHHSSGVNLELKKHKSKYVIQTERDDPKLPALFVFCGSRGSGKTYACVAMVKHFEKKHYITRTFLICPTKQSNDIFKNLKTLNDKVDVCDDETRCKHSLNNILQEVKKEWGHYEKEKEYRRVYKKNIEHPHKLDLKERTLLDSRGGAEPKDMVRPSHMLIEDDCQGMDMYTIIYV